MCVSVCPCAVPCDTRVLPLARYTVRFSRYLFVTYLIVNSLSFSILHAICLLYVADREVGSFAHFLQPAARVDARKISSCFYNFIRDACRMICCFVLSSFLCFFWIPDSDRKFKKFSPARLFPPPRTRPSLNTENRMVGEHGGQILSLSMVSGRSLPLVLLPSSVDVCRSVVFDRVEHC